MSWWMERFRRRRAVAVPSLGASLTTHAAAVARADIAHDAEQRPFRRGTRPVLRWVKGDGLDDDVTRAALLAATRRFGTRVDYCLCTNGIDAARARDILAGAQQPVEWWPVTPADNESLAALLAAAGAAPEAFGYWWKWFPERVRPGGPEWILDGDMVVLDAPPWFAEWEAGGGGCRVTAEDSDRHPDRYGAYDHLVDRSLELYSGLICLPPGMSYQDTMCQVLAEQPLAPDHDGRTDMSEQGVVAATFQRLGATPIPLAQFPFARAFEPDLDFGRAADPDTQTPWGYHFGNSFRRDNPHFDAMTSAGTIPARSAPSRLERYAWLGGVGQWGVPGWTLGDACVSFILSVAEQYAGQRVLEIGTSRGRLTAMLADLGCQVTTVDHIDRGARENLAGLGVDVQVADGRQFVAAVTEPYDLLVIDVHGNSETEWRSWAPLLRKAVRRGGRIVIDNLRLADIPEWHEESGVAWLAANPPTGLRVEQRFEDDLPGVVVLRRG